MREQTEIDAEIAKLKEMKPRVRHFSIFNDDNHAKIEAQIETLAENLDDDDIYDKWDVESGDGLNGAAFDALAWKDGEQDEPPSVAWEPLLTK